MVADDSDGPPSWDAESITGRVLIIEYRDTRGQVSNRQITCRNLADRAGTLYLQAWCHARRAPRCFRVDRIAGLADSTSGEIYDVADFFRAAPREESHSAYHFGLSVRQFADFNAALNVLAFLARCDGRWHPMEGERIEQFVSSYWLRSEIRSDLDLATVRRHVDRLAPDAESFWVSLSRCAEHPVLRPIIRQHAGAVVDADGVHHPQELYWGRMIDEFIANTGS